MVLQQLCFNSATSEERRCIRARLCGGAVRDGNAFAMATPHSLGNAAKPSVADIADSEGFAVGDAQLEMSSPCSGTGGALLGIEGLV